MQLRGLIRTGAMLALAAMTSVAVGQSLSPMTKEGVTPSDVKGFKLTVGNPYPSRMTFIAVPMDRDFNTEIKGAVTKPAEFKLAPGASRPIQVQFNIDPGSKERTIGVCIYPKSLEGPVLPRVCGRYTGRRAGG